MAAKMEMEGLDMNSYCGHSQWPLLIFKSHRGDNITVLKNESNYTLEKNIVNTHMVLFTRFLQRPKHFTLEYHVHPPARMSAMEELSPATGSSQSFSVLLKDTSMRHRDDNQTNNLMTVRRVLCQPRHSRPNS